jgi:2-dehydropantoate 2-reductase
MACCLEKKLYFKMIRSSEPPSSIAIVGSGALGSLFAAFLEPVATLVMFAHWPEQIHTLSDEGLTCIHLDGRRTKHLFPVTSNPHALGKVTLALVLVKSYQTARTALEIAPILAPDGLAVTFQNGLGNFETLEAALGYGRVAQGVTAQGATMFGPGVVKHAGHGPSYIALTAGRQALISGLAELMQKAGLPSEITGDVQSLQWGKLAVNAGINPLTAILRVPNGFLADNEVARAIMCAAAEETAAVAAAMDIQLPYNSASERTVAVAQGTRYNYSSMLQDVLRGAPTEIDAISGAVADHGRRLGVPTPVNTELWRIVRGFRREDKSQDPGDAERLLRNLQKQIEQSNDYNQFN